MLLSVDLGWNLLGCSSGLGWADLSWVHCVFTHVSAISGWGWLESGMMSAGKEYLCSHPALILQTTGLDFSRGDDRTRRKA